MNFSYLIYAFLLILSLVPASPARAETRYVIDQLLINLKEGMGAEYKTIATIRTGTALEVLEKSPPYLKVRTEKGVVGYVKIQYLTRTPPKSILLAGLLEENKNLRNRVAEIELDRDRLADELNKKRAEHTRRTAAATGESELLQDDLLKVQADMERITAEYDSLVEKSKRVIATATERDRLREENTRLNKELQIVKDESFKMLWTGMIKWFLAGAGVLFFGWLMGKTSKRKKAPL